jgi:hypothetical protein
VREVYAIEQLRLMVLADPVALSRVEQPESLLKDCQNIFVRHGHLCSKQNWLTQLYLQSFLERCTAGNQAEEKQILKLICRVSLDG